jgi:cytochrome oxidase Cu insertion factor (SCO1/SenC/PrrC family)
MGSDAPSTLTRTAAPSIEHSLMNAMTVGSRRLPMLALSIVIVPFAMVSAQQPVRLGPRDDARLPPTDLNRVAVDTIAPDFTLEALDGSRVTLSQFRGKQNVVLVFYRGHW